MIAAVVIAWIVAVLLIAAGLAWLAISYLAAMMDPKGRGLWETFRSGILIVAGGIALIVMLLWPAPASAAQSPFCYPWIQMRDALAAFGETPIGGGVVDDNIIVQITASAAGSFTIVLIDTTGLACAISAGADWDPGRLPVPAAEERDS